MTSQYHPETIEKNAQSFWEKHKTFETNTDQSAIRHDNYYCLSMFPYTSGNIHMGHVRNYTIGDVKSRIKKMQGYNVLQPMGWDSFGLPAENAAIKNKSHPAVWTRENIKHMRTQLQRIGFAFDWSRDFATCDPAYYRWQQWLFIKMYKKDLVYKKNAIVNWDPVDQTVLANEQVVNGRGWRSNALVEQKNIAQWFCRITSYAERLNNDLQTLNQWPEAVKTMQSNWIGKSVGAEVHFKVEGKTEPLTVFTTRADTLYGATFMAIAADHPLAQELAKSDEKIAAFAKRCRQQSTAEADIQTAEKIGIATPLHAINPINKERIPIWIANYILMSYGTGAIMAVPAEDERDHAFATKYNLPVNAVYDDKNRLLNADTHTGMSQEQATKAIIASLEKNKQGTQKTTFRLRDWGISRQRYWGVPIPIIHCPHCGEVTEKEENLPVTLPENIDYQYGDPLLKNCEAFYKTTCPECGTDAVRETDTFDTFFDSSWYYQYFISQGKDGICSIKNDQWLGVDLYIGGIEHAILHLLYARFMQKVLFDLQLSEVSEPFTRLLSQGMVLKDGAKMSKSKGNVVSPDTLIKTYGADTIRLFVIFAAPPTQDLEWSDGAIEGCFRFLKRLWAFVDTHYKILSLDNNHGAFETLSTDTQQIIIDLHKELRVIERDANHIHLNTVASGAMKLFQLIGKLQKQEDAQGHLRDAVSILLRVLNPITPHITHALWQKLALGENIATAEWPTANQSILNTANQTTIVMQINGKKKGMVTMHADASESEVISILKADPSTSVQLDKHEEIKKTIYVKNKLINFVV